MDHLSEDERVDRGDLGGLQHHGAADGEGRSHLEGDLVERVVPRGDGAHDADRLAHHERVANLLLEGKGLHVSCEVGERLDRKSGLHGHREADGHADLVGDELTDLGHARAEGLADAGHVLGALLVGRGSPGREGGGGRSDGTVDVLSGPVGDGGHELFGGGVEDLERPGSSRGHPGPVDVDLVADVDVHGPSLG